MLFKRGNSKNSSSILRVPQGQNVFTEEVIATPHMYQCLLTSTFKLLFWVVAFCYLYTLSPAITHAIYEYLYKVPHLPYKNFENFGEILDETIKHLNLKQIDLTKLYDIDSTTISTDRRSYLTRRRMMKYWTFMKEFNISEDFFLRGNYPILIDEVSEQAKAQETIDALLKEKYRLEELLRDAEIEIKRLRRSLKRYIDKYGELKPR